MLVALPSKYLDFLKVSGFSKPLKAYLGMWISILELHGVMVVYILKLTLKSFQVMQEADEGGKGGILSKSCDKILHLHANSQTNPFRSKGVGF